MLDLALSGVKGLTDLEHIASATHQRADYMHCRGWPLQGSCVCYVSQICYDTLGPSLS